MFYQILGITKYQNMFTKISNLPKITKKCLKSSASNIINLIQ